MLFALSSVFALRYKSQLGLVMVISFLFLLVAGLSSQRQLPFWGLLLIPLLTTSFNFFSEEVGKDALSRRRFEKVYQIVFLSVLLIFILQAAGGLFSLSTWSEENYPKNAVSFLQQEKLAGNIFNPYHWGGYLTWKFPEKKVFIDGRMPSWRWQAPGGESNGAFDEYNDILSSKLDLKTKFTKYGITTVIWPKSLPRDKSLIPQVEEWLTSQLMSAFNQKYASPLEDRLKALGWKRVYEDNVTVIYRQ